MEERQGVVDRFNSFGIGKVFLLSTRAGGAGLNLVGANHLVLYDRCAGGRRARQHMDLGPLLARC